LLSEINSKIKIFASDDNLKTLGELLSNDSSRQIISALMNNEMYTNEISTKLDMRVSLVIHHLKKLEELRMVEITSKKIKRKGVEHRFFKINSEIFITVNKDKAEIESQGLLSRIFKDGIKFVGIGIAGMITLFGTISLQTDTSSKPTAYMDKLVLKIPYDLLWSVVFTCVVLSISLFLIHLQRKKKDD